MPEILDHPLPEAEPELIVPCSVCGQETHNVDTLQGRRPCHECVHYCGSCNASYVGDMPDSWYETGPEGTPRCHSCSEDWLRCYGCDHSIDRDNTYYDFDIPYCASCLPTNDDEEESPPDSVIGGYHSSQGIFPCYTSPWTRSHSRYIGVELEVEQVNGNRETSATRIIDAVIRLKLIDQHTRPANLLVRTEHDGSLNSGFEIITAPLGLDDQRNLWATILTPTNVAGLRSHNTTTCGLHVHITRKGLSKLQIAKIVAFVNSATNYAFMKRLSRRYGTHYCKAKNKPLCTGASNLDHDRYEMVNLCNSKTIEFRIFRGTLKLESLLACIEFATALVSYCAPASGYAMDINSVTFRKFINTPRMKADTKHLRGYLANVIPAAETE